jgi:hypothetical protein
LPLLVTVLCFGWPACRVVSPRRGKTDPNAHCHGHRQRESQEKNLGARSRLA